MWRTGEREIGEPAEQRLQADFTFQTGQRGTDAVVNTAGERQILICLGPLDVKPLGIREHRGITVRAAQQRDDQ